MSKQQFVLTGTGGQGLILAAIVIAEAAVLSRLNAVQSQSYGPEARGGASKAEVIVSDQVIHYPHVHQPDFVITMSEQSYKQYGLDLREEAVLIVDNTYVTNIKPRGRNLYSLPITKMARVTFGSEQSANIVAVGVVAALSDVVPFEQLREAVARRVPKGTVDQNTKAMELGWNLGREAKATALSKIALNVGEKNEYEQ